MNPGDYVFRFGDLAFERFKIKATTETHLAYDGAYGDNSTTWFWHHKDGYTDSYNGARSYAMSCIEEADAKYGVNQ